MPLSTDHIVQRNTVDHGITTTVSHRDAERLIGLAGGTRNPRGGFDILGKHYWQTDEALMIALLNISDANGIAI